MSDRADDAISGVPRIVWQAEQPLARKSSLSAARRAALPARPPAACCCASQCAKSAFSMHHDRKGHQGVRGSTVLGAGAAKDAGARRLQRQPVRRPGIMSIFPPRAGIQKEWITSGLSS